MHWRSQQAWLDCRCHFCRYRQCCRACWQGPACTGQLLLLTTWYLHKLPVLLCQLQQAAAHAEQRAHRCVHVQAMPLLLLLVVNVHELCCCCCWLQPAGSVTAA
jgi:hypothetical protein